MSCTSPLKAFIIGWTLHNKPEEKYTPKYGTYSKKLKVVSYDVDYLYLDGNYWQKGYGEWNENPHVKSECEVVTEFIEIPCGKCISCRLKHSREWANRCMLESMYHNNNYFVTLTYNDDNLPYRLDEVTGEINKDNPSLVPDEISKFIKRLRRKIEYKIDKENGFYKLNKKELKKLTEDERIEYLNMRIKRAKIQEENSIRFFGCGEYGEKHQRPHYHVILFNCNLDDLKPARKFLLNGEKHNKNQEYEYMESQFLNEAWQNKGYVLVGNVTFDSCCYTARYITKKLGGDLADIEYDNKNRIAPFVRMSRMPGIAKQYYDDFKDKIYYYDSITLKGTNNKPPRYFDKLFDIEYPSASVFLHEFRSETANKINDNKFRFNDIDIKNQYKIDNMYLKELTKSLKRDKM